MPKIQAISLRSQWLGEKLREARLSSGYLMREAADYVQTDQGSLSRFERGTHRIKRAYVRELLDFYGVPTGEREYLLRLADDAWRKDWWDGDSSDLESWFIDYTWIESRANKIHNFEPLIIPGLLQTSSYAEALASAGLGRRVTKKEVARTVEVRMSRQRILHSERPARLSVVVEKAALERPVGGTSVLEDQLKHLTEVSRLQHIDIRVLPPDAPWDPGHHGPFSHFEMPDPYPEIAFIENLAGRTFLEESTRVERFKSRYDQLRKLCLSPTASISFIKELMKDLQ